MVMVFAIALHFAKSILAAAIGLQNFVNDALFYKSFECSINGYSIVFIINSVLYITMRKSGITV